MIHIHIKLKEKPSPDRYGNTLEIFDTDNIEEGVIWVKERMDRPKTELLWKVDGPDDGTNWMKLFTGKVYE